MRDENKLKKLKKIYQNIDTQISNLLSVSCLQCVDGCGECCTRFEPYISVLEGIPIAEYLLAETVREEIFRKNLAENRQCWKACLFYDFENKLHCSIYTIRPLICRLFGFAANLKGDINEFSTCKKIEIQMPTQVRKAFEFTQKGGDVPVYQKIAAQIQEIDFHLATDYHPFSKSVEIAIELLKNKIEVPVSREINPDSEAMPFSIVVRRKLHELKVGHQR